MTAPEPFVARPRAYRAGAGWFVANVVALLSVAVALRAWQLGNIPGVNGDEAWAGVQAARLLAGESVAWRTPHGNPLNLFLVLPLAALQAVALPSFTLLRLPSLVSGLVALIANYFLCRRAFDGRTALISTIFLALLPIDIAYSRFAWDASPSLLATLFVLYLPIAHCRARGAGSSLSGWAMLALVAAIYIHPTNVFAAPLLVIPVALARRKQLDQVLRDTEIPARGWCFAAVAAISVAAAYLAWQAISRGIGHLHGPGDLTAFAINYVRLFSGSTIYEFIAGTNLAASASTWFDLLPTFCDLAFAGAAIIALVGMAKRLSQEPTAGDTALVWGWLVMLGGFFLIAGPSAIAPHQERYGVCLLAPAALVFARGISWWLDTRQAHHRRAAIALAAIVWLWPVTFYLGYFEFIQQTGGQSHRTFRTAAVEPKLQAYELMLAASDSSQPMTIVCQDWWCYWPIAFLAANDADVKVLTWQEWKDRVAVGENSWKDPAWFVEFAGTNEEEELTKQLEIHGRVTRVQLIRDYSGRPLLSLFAPAEYSSQNY
jgi:hypothetical protein